MILSTLIPTRLLPSALTRTFVLFALLSLPLTSFPKATIHVSPDGSDRAVGSLDAPLATLNIALRKARELRRLGDESVRDGVEILLHDGVYRLVEPVRIRPEDSGTPTSPTLIRAAEGATPVFSGGTVISGWQKVVEYPAGLPEAARGRVWVAEAPRSGGRPFFFRDLWVGEERGIRAREPDDMELPRILDWDKEQREGWIPVPGNFNFENPSPAELVIHQMWAIAILRIREMDVQGDRARVTFHEPESRIQFEHPWPPVVLSEDGNSAYYLTNAIEFLDSPGEWYQDLDGKVYYWPEDPKVVRKGGVIAPVLETLVEVKGTVDRTVQHVTIEGIRFSHTTWNRPSKAGHVPLQAGMFMLDAYKLKTPGTPDKGGLENQAWIGRPPAAVELSATESVRFHRCRFENLAASGVDFIESSLNDAVEGCLFREIGGNGIVAGAIPDGGFETHVPWDPADERILCRNLRIANNLVTDVARTDWGCVGILAGCVRGINIEHNTVNDVSYTGISMGWTWTKSVNTMRNNRIHANHIHHYGRHMYDTGGIYTLSPQSKSFITENRVHSIYRPAYVHDPHHWSYIYLDEGSSFFIVQDNWTEGTKYSTNANGPGNTWENNGPDVDMAIHDAAGLEPEYRDLLEYSAVRPDSPVK